MKVVVLFYTHNPQVICSIITGIFIKVMYLTTIKPLPTYFRECPGNKTICIEFFTSYIDKIST